MKRAYKKVISRHMKRAGMKLGIGFLLYSLTLNPGRPLNATVPQELLQRGTPRNSSTEEGAAAWRVSDERTAR